MIKTTYQSKEKITPEHRRFVKRIPGSDKYLWCVQSSANQYYDAQQGTCDEEDLPESTRKMCAQYSGSFYACEWPINCK